MFGYVMANKPELKMREFARYKGIYCGLCRRLKKQYGILGQMTLTYDMTFLILLLSSLYEPETKEEKRRCLLHPGRKQVMCWNEITDYAADMNILLTEEHLRDDWEDERKLSGYFGMKAFSRKKKKIANRYKRQSQTIAKSLAQLAEREKENSQNIDDVARPFGELMGELFVWKEDSFEKILRSFGFYLGKFIYIMDACMDVEEDEKKGCFNPFLARSKEPDFREWIEEILDGTIKMAIVEFEKLPLEQDLPILRNILYEGVFTNYERKLNHDDKSL